VAFATLSVLLVPACVARIAGRLLVLHLLLRSS